MASIEISYKVGADTQVRIGYKKADTDYNFTYLSSYLSFSDSPYTIDKLSIGSYEVEITPTKDTCNGRIFGTPQVIRAEAANPNTIIADVLIGIDSNKNVYFSVELSEKITGSLTITGTYTIASVTTNYSVTIPSGSKTYATVLNITTYTQLDKYCYSTVNPSTINGKTVSLTSISSC